MAYNVHTCHWVHAVLRSLVLPRGTHTAHRATHPRRRQRATLTRCCAASDPRLRFDTRPSMLRSARRGLAAWMACGRTPRSAHTSTCSSSLRAAMRMPAGAHCTVTTVPQEWTPTPHELKEGGAWSAAMRDAPSPRLAAFDTAGQLSTSRVARCMPFVIRCAAYRAEAERLAVRLRPDAGGPCARCAPDAAAGRR